MSRVALRALGFSAFISVLDWLPTVAVVELEDELLGEDEEFPFEVDGFSLQIISRLAFAPLDAIAVKVARPASVHLALLPRVCKIEVSPLIKEYVLSVVSWLNWTLGLKVSSTVASFGDEMLIPSDVLAVGLNLLPGNSH